MTFLGKVLIVVQVVLSLCFMAFAGAVVAVHQNWRDEYNAGQSTIQALQGDLNNLRDTRDSEMDQLQVEIDAANEEARQFQLAATASEQQLQASIRDNQNLSQEIRRLEGEVEAAGMEAAFRLEEAQEQRAENRAQQTALDATQTELRNANDQIFALGVEFADLQRRYTALQEDNAHNLALLRQNGIDPATERLLGNVLAPPPPVDGRILEVQFDDAGRPRMVLLSLGEDDGLAVGHVLDVFRVKDGETIYIGQVRVTGEPLPDRVVAEVLTENRNGIIEVSDYVTTKL